MAYKREDTGGRAPPARVPPGVTLGAGGKANWLTTPIAANVPAKAPPASFLDPAAAALKAQQDQTAATTTAAKTTADAATAAAATQAKSQYEASVSGSSVDQSMSDLQAFGLSAADAKTATDWYAQERANLVSPAEMNMKMYQQGWFQTAFPGITQQIKNGQVPMSPQDYVTFKQGVQNFSANYGIPKGFITDADIGNAIGNGLTFTQVSDRLGAAFNAAGTGAAQDPQAAALLEKWYGIKPGSGAMAAFYLDPERTQTLLAQSSTAAAGGAAAQQAGFTKLDQGTLMSIAAHGTTAATLASTAQAEAGALGATRAGAGNLPTATEGEMLASQGIGGAAPGETQEQAMSRVQAAVGARTAQFKGGGATAGGGAAGTSGAGSGTQ